MRIFVAINNDSTAGNMYHSGMPLNERIIPMHNNGIAHHMFNLFSLLIALIKLKVANATSITIAPSW